MSEFEGQSEGSDIPSPGPSNRPYSEKVRDALSYKNMVIDAVWGVGTGIVSSTLSYPLMLWIGIPKDNAWIAAAGIAVLALAAYHLRFGRSARIMRS